MPFSALNTPHSNVRTNVKCFVEFFQIFCSRNARGFISILFIFIRGSNCDSKRKSPFGFDSFCRIFVICRFLCRIFFFNDTTSSQVHIYYNVMNSVAVRKQRITIKYLLLSSDLIKRMKSSHIFSVK